MIICDALWQEWCIESWRVVKPSACLWNVFGAMAYFLRLSRQHRRRLAAAVHLEAALAEQAFARVAQAEEALRRAEAAAGVAIELTGKTYMLLPVSVRNQIALQQSEEVHAVRT